MEEDPPLNPDLIISHKFPETIYTYNERDAALYALGVGACTRDALDTDELKYVYHQDGQQNIQVLPTFAALFSLGFTKEIANLPGLPYDPHLLLHGQQYIEIHKPLPSNGSNTMLDFHYGNISRHRYTSWPNYRDDTDGLVMSVNKEVQNKASISGLHDKGKAAIIEIEIDSYKKESGELLCKNRMACYLRGAGGFSKSSPPFSFSKYPKNQTGFSKPPKSQPFTVFEESTQPPQALLYRLSGDYNPLHSDPMIAEIAGFSRPILHGLCTLGFAVRAITKCICKGDPNMIKTISGQFLLHVYPGETLITEMWLEGLRVLYQVKVKERNRAVLSGFVDLSRLSSSL